MTIVCTDIALVNGLWQIYIVQVGGTLWTSFRVGELRISRLYIRPNESLSDWKWSLTDFDIFSWNLNSRGPIPVAARFKAWVCGRWIAGIAVSNPTGAWMSLVSFVCCQVDISATFQSLVQKSPSECGVSGGDLETSMMRRPRPTGATEPWKKKFPRTLILLNSLRIPLRQYSRAVM